MHSNCCHNRIPPLDIIYVCLRYILRLINKNNKQAQRKCFSLRQASLL
uniref:Uncharacterized protein n=1 Tax=Siphoviridae sp. ctnMb19 TaxID=2825659 RepID=A0A8S5NVC2_9CAUD|nr:MAG TPA: hypothetical protein [Siphoviridae sp. ctnMb19]